MRGNVGGSPLSSAFPQEMKSWPWMENAPRHIAQGKEKSTSIFASNGNRPVAKRHNRCIKKERSKKIAKETRPRESKQWSARRLQTFELFLETDNSRSSICQIANNSSVTEELLGVGYS
jgi:hypothetical protein